jgi:L-ribulose-5-phosphate 3-epimerase
MCKGAKVVNFERLGVLTDEVSQDFIVALNWTTQHNLSHVEIRMVNGENVANLTDDQLDKILREVEQRGLYVSGIASPLFKCALDPTRPVVSGDMFGQKEEDIEEHFDKLDRVIQIARKLKTDKIRIFSFWRELDPIRYEEEIVDHLKRASKIAEQENVILLLENEGACNGGYAEEVARIVGSVNSPNLRALWDPGNEEHAGGSAYPEGYASIKDYIGHVHLKDAFVDENGEGRCVPIGSGNVAFIEQLNALDKDGYSGLFTIETHYVPNGGTAMDGTLLTLEGLNKILQVMRN